MRIVMERGLLCGGLSIGQFMPPARNKLIINDPATYRAHGQNSPGADGHQVPEVTTVPTYLTWYKK